MIKKYSLIFIFSVRDRVGETQRQTDRDIERVRDRDRQIEILR